MFGNIFWMEERFFVDIRHRRKYFFFFCDNSLDEIQLPIKSILVWNNALITRLKLVICVVYKLRNIDNFEGYYSHSFYKSNEINFILSQILRTNVMWKFVNMEIIVSRQLLRLTMILLSLIQKLSSFIEFGNVILSWN